MSWTTPLTWTTGQIVTAANLNQQVRDNENFLYGDTSWTAPSFGNGWGNAPSYAVGFRLVGTRVVVRGRMSGGTMSTTAFTFPVGYHPTAANPDCGFAVDSNGAYGRVVVSNAGALGAYVGSNAYVQLDGVTFDTI